MSKRLDEFDNEPSTNKCHVYNASGYIDSIVEECMYGGLCNVNKETIEKIGNATWYRFMINRIHRSDVDVFCDEFEGEAFFVQTAYYSKSENFLYNALIYQRLCNLMKKLYDEVYINNNKESIIELYKFIQNELSQLVSDNSSDEFRCPIALSFTHDLIRYTTKMVTSMKKNDITDILISKLKDLKEEYDSIFIVERTSVSTHYNYDNFYGENGYFKTDDVSANLKNHILEVVQLLDNYAKIVSKY